MAIYRTDRDRRILGDRIVARIAEFNAVHSAVAEIASQFANTHADLASSIDARIRETGEDEKERQQRDEAWATGQKLYTWAYNQLPSQIMPSWDAEIVSETLEITRKAIFPLGSPSEVFISEQKTLDGLEHFVLGVARESGLNYPQPFLNAATQAKENLQKGIDAVTRDMAETASAVTKVLEFRSRWDELYRALQEVTSAFLRVQQQDRALLKVFRALPSSLPWQTADGEVEAPVVDGSLGE